MSAPWMRTMLYATSASRRTQRAAHQTPEAQDAGLEVTILNDTTVVRGMTTAKLITVCLNSKVLN